MMELLTRENIELAVTIIIGIIMGVYGYFAKRGRTKISKKVEKYEINAGKKISSPLELGTDDQQTLLNTVGYLVDHSKMTDKRMVKYEEERKELLTKIECLESQISALEASSVKKDAEIRKLKKQRRALVERLRKLEAVVDNSPAVDTGNLIITQAHQEVLLEMKEEEPDGK